jgi:2,4-dienoyl-CoA reductase-like NADH-dependent reductase (Old Yellow Enzyme family)
MSVAWRSVAPSAVPFRVPVLGIPVALTPRALTVPEIELVVAQFADAAALAVQAGFDGS